MVQGTLVHGSCTCDKQINNNRQQHKIEEKIDDNETKKKARGKLKTKLQILKQKEPKMKSWTLSNGIETQKTDSAKVTITFIIMKLDGKWNCSTWTSHNLYKI